jgi:hypothetical protein
MPFNQMVCRTVELSRRSVARALLFSAKGVTRVTVGFSDLFYVQVSALSIIVLVANQHQTQGLLSNYHQSFEAP